MGRILGSNIRNVFSVLDPVSGREIDLYYRMPTGSERIAYESAKFGLDQKGALVSHATEARQEYGLLILEGFKKGGFHLPCGVADSPTPQGDSLKDISSDPADPDYIADWKDKIKEFAIDLVEVLAHRIFDGPPVIMNQEDQRKN